MTCPYLDYRSEADGRSFDVERAYCTAAERFVEPMRVDLRNDRYELSHAECEIYQEYESGRKDGHGNERGATRGYPGGESLIVTVAPTGGAHGKEAHPELPETPERRASGSRS